MGERGQGVYAISRDFWDDPDFSDAPYSDREAWLWLVGAAAWKGVRARGGGAGPVTLKRGEFSFSVRFLAEKWKWSKSAVDRFLAKLEKRDMVRDASRDGSKVYFIRNYNKFQVVGAPKRDSDGDTVRDSTGTEAGQHRDKEETGETGETGEIADRVERTQPLSDPLRGPDGVGGISGAGQEEPVAPPSARQSPARAAGGVRSATAGPASDGFERFWKQADAPKTASKMQARMAWAKTRPGRPADDVLIACHAAYRAAVAAENAKRRQERPPRAAQSLCHPVTFLLERRWEGFLAAATAAPAMPAPPDWGAHGQALAAKLGPAVFAQWFAGARLDAGDPVTITVDSLFRMRWIEDHFRPALEHEFGETVRIEAKRKALAA